MGVFLFIIVWQLNKHLVLGYLFDNGWAVWNKRDVRRKQ